MATRSRNVSCTGCGTKHSRPVSKNCTRSSLQIAETAPTVSAASSSMAAEKTEDQGQDVNMQMMSLLQNLSGKMDTLASKVNTLETAQHTDDISQLQSMPVPTMSDSKFRRPTKFSGSVQRPAPVLQGHT